MENIDIDLFNQIVVINGGDSFESEFFSILNHPTNRGEIFDDVFEIIIRIVSDNFDVFAHMFLMTSEIDINNHLSSLLFNYFINKYSMYTGEFDEDRINALQDNVKRYYSKDNYDLKLEK